MSASFCEIELDGRKHQVQMLADGRLTCDCCDAAVTLADAGEPLRCFSAVYCPECFDEVIEAQA